MSADPRIVPDARLIEMLSFSEAAELACSGARVLHPKAIEPAMMKGIPVVVKNSLAPEDATPRGTTISTSFARSRDSLATAITHKRGVTMVDVATTSMLGTVGFLHHVFAALAALGLSVDVVATSEVSVSMTLDEPDHGLDTLTLEALRDEVCKFGDVRLERKKAKVTLVGSPPDRTQEFMECVGGALRKIDVPIHVISCAHSKANVTLVLEEDDVDKAVQMLHACFFPEQK
eukprot:Polyplicarium_translucidae@DN2410_c0_g1_i1.p1